jgi:hypothetical protein
MLAPVLALARPGVQELQAAEPPVANLPAGQFEQEVCEDGAYSPAGQFEQENWPAEA